jgi:serine/threonine protein kinase
VTVVTSDDELLLERLRKATGDAYEIRSVLGRGGMGAVILADDKRLEREVAIKVLPPELTKDPELVRRFEQEARTAARLDHPGIIPIFAVENDGDLHYFVMRYVRGKALDDVLLAGPMPVNEAQRIVFEAAAALAHAHRRGVVHRDVKPANIMLDEAGRVLLTDFGISKVAESASNPLTATGRLIGTPLYMSPEQCKGDPVDGRSDVYQLAAVGFHLLTGRVPFDDDSIHTVMYKHIYEQPPDIRTLRSDIPEAFAEALMRALAKTPAERFLTMDAFAAAVAPDRATLTSSGEVVVQPGVRFSTPTVRMDLDYHPVRSADTPLPFITAPVPGVSRKPLIGVAILSAIGLVLAITSRIGAPASPAAGAATTTAPSGQPAAPVVTAPVAATNPSISGPQPLPGTARPGTSFLTVDATPFGTVYVNGYRLDDTPVAHKELPAGQYVIEVRHPGSKTAVDTQWIVPGNEPRLRYTLVPEAPAPKPAPAKSKSGATKR